MNQVRLVKMGMEEVGLVVVRVAWVVGERRGRVGSVGGRSRLGTGDANVDADADRDTLYQHLVLHLLLKRVQIHQILTLLLHHLNKFQWNLKLQRCHHRYHIRKPNQQNKVVCS